MANKSRKASTKLKGGAENPGTAISNNVRQSQLAADESSASVTGERANLKRVVSYLRDQIAERPEFRVGEHTSVAKLFGLFRNASNTGDPSNSSVPLASMATVKRAVRQLSDLGIFKASGRNGLEVISRFPLKEEHPGTQDTIGCIFAEVEDAFLGLVIRGIIHAARSNGRYVIISDSSLDADKELTAVRELLPRTCGLILVPVRSGSKTAEIQSLAERANKPIVCVERRLSQTDASDPFPLIATDNRQGGRLAGEHLIEKLLYANQNLGGCKLFVIGREETTGQSERLTGFRDAIEKARDRGLSIDEIEVFWTRPLNCSYFELKSKVIQALKLDAQESEFLKTLQSATDKRRVGLFCMSDAVALTVYAVLEERGYLIPEHILLVGFDDLFYAEAVDLTTIHQRFEDLGSSAVTYLLSKDRTEPIREKPELRQRRTTSVTWSRHNSDQNNDSLTPTAPPVPRPVGPSASGPSPSSALSHEANPTGVPIITTPCTKST